MSEIHRARPQLQAVTRRAVLRGMAGMGAAAALGPLAAACGGSAGTPAPSTGPAATPSGTSSGGTPPPAASTAPTTAPTPAASPEGELFVYNWADYIGADTISKFESTYGIKVTYDFFDTVDTMTAKVSSGNSGYDVTFPTSINVKGFAERKLIQPLDLTLIPNIANLAPEWQNPAYDPGNANSMPYMWWTTGVAYDSDKITETLTSWDALWDARWSGKMAMLDDPREVFAAALIKLGYDINTIDDAQLDEALALLKQQQPLLRTYTTDDIGVLSTGDVWVMHAWGADVYQVTAERPSVKYYLPAEGAVRGSDTMVLLAGAKHPVAAHLFMNYMLDAQVSAANTNFIGYMGPNAAARQYIDPAILGDPAVNPDKALVDKLKEILDLGADEVKYSERWTKLRAGA
jgi:spermidine/putrescine transport system substrate-binding protein